MKSTLEFAHERNVDLYAAYRRVCSRLRYISLDVVARMVVDSPARRFWVSEERAAIVMSDILRGRPVLDKMRPTKREMYLEIMRRLKVLRAKHPRASLIDLVTQIVYSPAPKFYMAPASALNKILKMRNGWYERHRKN